MENSIAAVTHDLCFNKVVLSKLSNLNPFCIISQHEIKPNSYKILQKTSMSWIKISSSSFVELLQRWFLLAMSFCLCFYLRDLPSLSVSFSLISLSLFPYVSL